MHTRLFVVVALLPLVGGFAQDVQTLEARFQKLEETIRILQEEMKKVQAEITAERQSQRPAPATPAPALPAESLGPPLPVTYIGTETRTRQTVEDYSDEAPRINNEELDPSKRGYFRMPGTQTHMRFTGFVKTDLFYDLNIDGLWYGGMVPSSFSIRPSRFVFEARQPLGNDTLKVFTDWDMYGFFGRNTPDLRSFWGQYKNFLAGQTWSAFGDPDVWPDTLDFQGPPGMVVLRTPQFRYTYTFNRHHSVAGTVEKSGTDVPFSTEFGVPVGSSSGRTLPDTTATRTITDIFRSQAFSAPWEDSSQIQQILI